MGYDHIHGFRHDPPGYDLRKRKSLCSHLGYQLERDSDEQSWDCPCHGTHFGSQGRLTLGLAQEGIFLE